VELDGTREKARLGANALLATSLAVARAAATDREAIASGAANAIVIKPNQVKAHRCNLQVSLALRHLQPT